MLYDADKVLKQRLQLKMKKNFINAQLDIFLDPNDPEVMLKQREQTGFRKDWIEAAQKSPIYKMIIDWKIALPLHPEYRTMPMVWYVPPLSSNYEYG